VKVRPGFARNYLLPQKKALRATKENREYFEKQRSQLEGQNLQRRQDAEKVSAKMEGLTVIIIRQAGEFGQLYGSVSTRDIATAITGAGFTVDRRQILLDVPIKTLGLHKTRVSLHPEVTVLVTLNVAPTEEEAAAQATGKTPGAPAGEAPTAETAEAAAQVEAEAPAAAPAADEAAPAKEPKKKKAKAKKSADAE
jgi:large subunit ribosomal protein L9